MRHLPLECITRVIELVDNHHDLFNLLTVSKDVFLIAARCLYHDPIKTSSGDYESSITKMVLFLLSLSPADSTTIDTIRRSNGLSPSGAPLDPKPTIDYLSLVKVIRWRYRSDYYSPLCSALKHSNEDLYKELTWAFVGHRLNEIEELEIDVDDQERYLKNVAKMTRLQTANGDDENLLAWAACEAEYYHRHSGEHQFGPLVPLEILDIRDGSPISNRAQDTQNLEATVNPPSSSLADTTATVTTEQRLQRESLEVRFHCPKLTTLTLWNQAVNLLDPTCFHFSPNIQHLELRNWNLMDLAFVNYGEDDSIKEPDVLKVLHPTRWTWDWHFPFLNRFRLEGDLHQLRFTLAFLYTCPSLERMELYHEATGIRFPLRVKGILDNPLDKTNNNNQTSPFTHNKLAKLTLGGNLEVGVDELASLLQALPSLKEIELGSIDFGNINFEDRELVEISRTHPALERVTTNIKCTTKPPSAIGLARIGDKRPNVGPNIGGDNGKDDSEMPEK
ncbi:hypothetical protein BGW41_001117 [Actinomortierella wolfii]|nr:hypothetical protein BGW41_001117 [Actinomortierella wolfii]